jgi:3-deoxy-alpha-D-manno-octulosonate 8-oxidase
MTSNGFRNVREIPRYVFAPGAVSELASLLDERRRSLGNTAGQGAVILIDEFFSRSGALAIGERPGDIVRFVATTDEPTTDGIDSLMADLRGAGMTMPEAIVGIGGGITLDTAKAVANLFTNPGSAASYQGWDLVKNPGIYKIAVPTISGTGAESSRTCVMTNSATGLKLGMNSDFTLFDQLIMDPDLSATVERNQYFYTGMDTYVHSLESLAGRYRNPIGDALSDTAIRICRDVFLDGDMMSAAKRSELMVASYLGGRAIATSFVGVVHPVSAALSVVLGTHHCLANCITMTVMDDFYPEECKEFRSMVDTQGVTIPSIDGRSLSDDQCSRMCAATYLHQKPLANALGPDFMDVLPPERLTELFRRM